MQIHPAWHLSNISSPNFQCVNVFMEIQLRGDFFVSHFSAITFTCFAIAKNFPHAHKSISNKGEWCACRIPSLSVAKKQWRRFQALNLQQITGSIRWWNLGVINWISLDAVDSVEGRCWAIVKRLSSIFLCMHGKIHLITNEPRRVPTEAKLNLQEHAIYLRRSNAFSHSPNPPGGESSSVATSSVGVMEIDWKATNYRGLKKRFSPECAPDTCTHSFRALIAKYLHFWQHPDTVEISPGPATIQKVEVFSLLL